MRRFEGRVALVTGAASGIGRATVERLAEEGAKLACVDLQAEGVEAAAKRARERGAEAIALACDVSDEHQVIEAVRQATQQLGGLQVLCNIAGVLFFEHTHRTTLADWQRIQDVNLTGTFLVCREAIPHLLENGNGAIVNMSSTAGIGAHAWTAAYSASKGGILAFTRCLAIEYGKQDLRSNAICPGGVETPIHESFRLPEGANQKLMKKMMPFHGFAGPEDVASTVAFLASDDARHINGEQLRVDGGMLA